MKFIFVIKNVHTQQNSVIKVIISSKIENPLKILRGKEFVLLQGCPLISQERALHP